LKRVVTALVIFIVAMFFLPILSDAALNQSTTVRLETSVGNFDIELFDTAAPLTVANFMNYVNSGAFNHSFFHRSAPGFVIQGGGYYIDDQSVRDIPVHSPVENEFSVDHSNLRGTVAMAKVAGDPDSATSQWFVNLVDNSPNLDHANGGYTVFGQISVAGMSIVDAIAGLQVVNAGGVFEHLPLLPSFNRDAGVRLADLVMVTSVSIVDLEVERQHSDRVFDYLESIYPQYISPSGGTSASADGYYYRHYPDRSAYIGTAGGRVYYFGPATENTMYDLGSLADWAERAAIAGY